MTKWIDICVIRCFCIILLFSCSAYIRQGIYDINMHYWPLLRCHRQSVLLFISRLRIFIFCCNTICIKCELFLLLAFSRALSRRLTYISLFIYCNISYSNINFETGSLCTARNVLSEIVFISKKRGNSRHWSKQFSIYVSSIRFLLYIKYFIWFFFFLGCPFIHPNLFMTLICIGAYCILLYVSVMSLM